MESQKRKFYEVQIFVHNETKINDYLNDIVETKNYFLETFLQDNNEFLELALNSFINSKTKNIFIQQNYGNKTV